jgi:F-type H+-transporting ATPase subunit b
MPQIDSVTFLSQLFWLTVCFFTFYSLVLSNVLPRLARILKVREKKVALDGQEGGRSNTEMNTMLSSYDTFILSTSSSARTQVQKVDEVSKEWISADLENIFSNNLARGTKACYNASADLVAKKRALIGLIASK